MADCINLGSQARPQQFELFEMFLSHQTAQDEHSMVRWPYVDSIEECCVDDHLGGGATTTRRRGWTIGSERDSSESE